MNDSILFHIEQHLECVERVRADAAMFQSLGSAARIAAAAITGGGKLLFCGNGGSAADAQHFAAEFIVRLESDRNPLPAIALTTDASLITAAGNDYGFDTIFSRSVFALGLPGDVLIAISTSGNSPNVVAAAEAALEKGLKVIRTPVGHFYIIEAVKKHKAVLGFERSGHMTIPSLRLFDDAILVAAKLLEICSKLEEPLSKFFDKLPTYLSTEVSLECPDSIKFKVVEAISNELKAKFKKVDTIDGVKVYTDKGWFLIRASNTQPLIRITVEAKNEKNLQELLNYAKSLVARAQKHYMT